VSANKNDISQIRKYLNGELDTHAMHELERQALDDPFLMDALEGYEQVGKNQQPNLDDLQGRIQQRIAPAKKRLSLWPAMGIAASLLVFLSIGGWWLINYRAPANKPDSMPADKTEVAARPLVTDTTKMPMPVDSTTVRQTGTPVAKPQPNATLARVKVPKDKALDEAKATSNEPIANAPALSLAPQRRMNDSLALANTFGKTEKQIRVRGTSSITTGNKPLYVVDGKIFNGELKDLKTTDIENLSVVKDASSAALYGARAANGVIVVTTKKGKAANRIMDTNLMAANRLNEVVVVGYGVQTKKDITGSVTSLKPVAVEQSLAGRVAGVSVSTNKDKAPLKTITGQVLSKSDGLPLPGVSIIVEGRGRGAQTDVNGKFKIEVANNDELDVKYVGFLSKRLKVKGNDSLKIALEESHDALAEVAVTGYGQPKKQIKEAHPITGWDEFQKYLEDKGSLADKAGVIRLSFIVNPDKTLSDFKILKGLNADANEEAIQMIKHGPGWIPNVNGKPETVKVRIRFKE
jgi:TonB-dependent SusC/RagA subfamily outer membrane receptor